MPFNQKPLPALALIATVASAGLLTGCSTSKLHLDLEAPNGSTVTFKGDTEPVPTTLAVGRPDKTGAKPKRKDIEFQFILGGQPVPAEGVLETFGYEEHDVDRLSRNFLKIQPSHIRDIERGSAIVLNGTSASGQHIYQLTIGQAR
ncbi:hypothetical protein [Mucisphaera sp.]|uniref:hypothetical protein n=1 Tax=Mucisphaera sp. TaxID=2913024 RepID=UPI003D149018